MIHMKNSNMTKVQNSKVINKNYITGTQIYYNDVSRDSNELRPDSASFILYRGFAKHLKIILYASFLPKRTHTFRPS